MDIKYFLAILIWSLFSCNQYFDDNRNIPVKIHSYDYYQKDKINSTQTFYLDRIIENDSLVLNYKYNESTDTLIFLLKKPINREDIIIWHDTKSPLVSVDTHIVKGKQLKVQKFIYDVVNSSDEECFVYYCEQYGCILIDNYSHYGIVYSLEYDDVTKELAEQLVEKINSAN